MVNLLAPFWFLVHFTCIRCHRSCCLERCFRWHKLNNEGTLLMKKTVKLMESATLTLYQQHGLVQKSEGWNLSKYSTISLLCSEAYLQRHHKTSSERWKKCQVLKNWKIHVFWKWLKTWGIFPGRKLWVLKSNVIWNLKSRKHFGSGEKK